MGKFIKILLGLIAALAILVIVAIVAISLFFDPNDYKDEITRLVQEQTGRELTIKGDIELSFFPWIGVETGQVRLSNAPGFPDRPMLQVEHAGASVKLLPLLRKEVVVDTVILEGAVVHLAKNAQGETNWQDLLPEGQQPSEAEAAGAGLAGLVVSGVQLHDSTITWTDLGKDTRYAASGIDLETSEITFGEPFELTLGFDLASPASGLDARVALNTDATVGTGFQAMQLDDLNLTLEGQYGTNQPMPLDLALSGDAALDLAAGTAQVSDLVLQAWNITADGQMQARNLNSELNYEGTLAVQEFSPEDLLATLTGAAPETRDPAVLNSAGMQLAFEGTADSLKTTLREATLDDTHLNGSVSITDFATMAMAFDLQLDRINLDRYLPPEAEAAEEQAPLATPGEAAAAGGALIPVDTLRGLNLNGSLHADALTFANMTASDIDLTVHAANGKLRIHPLNAQFYSGTYQGDIRIDATGREPILSINESAQGIQAGPLLEDVAGKTWLTGTGGMSLNTTANLASPEAAKRSLSGAFRLNFEDGAVFGINIPKRIRQAAALLQGQTLEAEEAVAKTDFSTLSVAAEIQNGVFHVHPISLQSPLLRVSGSGTVNLREMSVDVTVKPVLVKTLEGQGGASLEQLTGVPIPLHISGPLMSPNIGLNLEAALQEKLKGRLTEELEGLLGEEAPAAQKTTEGKAATKEPAAQPPPEEQLKERALEAIFAGEEEEEEKQSEPPPLL